MRALFAGDARLLLVGVRNFGHAGALELPGLEALPSRGERFDAAVWCADGDPARGLRLLRAHVRPGALIALWVEPTGLAAQLWSLLARGPARTKLPLEQACEALLLAGLDTPRVLARGRQGFAVSGRVPAPLGPLDAFFEQPPA
ncbi:MAG TPA: hypothetical protein VFZ61_00370 [Polyangiales bacterium]